MLATPAPSVPDLRAQFEGVLARLTSEEAQHVSADTMERRLLSQVLALGRAWFALFLARRAAATEGRTHSGPDGVERPYHDERARPYLSIFGRVVFARPYFYGRGRGGTAPVDGALSLPPTVCSDLVRETAEELGMEEAYHKGLGVLRRLLGLALSTRTLQEQVAEDAPEVEAFYAQQAPPPAEEEAAILVLQADGKGVPILRPLTAVAGTPAPLRLGKGQKRGGKKEAMLTAVYTIAPVVRTPEEVVESLFRAPSEERGAGDAEREAPRHKRLWATLAGKDAALDEAAAQVARRDGPRPHRARRPDRRESGAPGAGARALPRRPPDPGPDPRHRVPVGRGQRAAR